MELLPWQQTQWDRLIRLNAANRLPHALLLCGQEGLGKQSFAQRFATALLCQTVLADGSPCGSCRSCLLLHAGNHPDYLLVTPQGSDKPIKVDQVRELCSFLNHTSQFSGFKIVVISAAHMLNISAANSLLKTLEEPPGDCLLLLVTAHPYRLPATVRSRCQTVVFMLPEMPQALAWLQEKLVRLDRTESKLVEIALNLSNGAPLQALAYARNELLAKRQELFAGYSDILLGKADPVQIAKIWSSSDLTMLINWLIGWHMDMIRLKMVAEPPHLFNPDLQPELQRLTHKLKSERLFFLLDAAIRLAELFMTQVNLESMLEDFFCECIDG